MDKKVKIIGIDKEGILKLDLLSDEINKNIAVEKVFPNQDVDKDYVRKLLDGVEVLFLIYDMNNKRAIQIASSMNYMANERKIVSVGIDVSNNFEENKNSILDVEFNYSDKLFNIINILSKYDTEESIISIDISDIREIFSKDNNVLYDYIEVNDDECTLNIVEKINSLFNCDNFITPNKKQIIFFEKHTDDNFNLENISNIVSSLNSKDYESIFMLSNSLHKNILKIAIIRS